MLRRNLLVRFGPNRVRNTPISESVFLGSGGRNNVQYDVPKAGAQGHVPKSWEAIPIGRSILRLKGDDVTVVSVGVGVHRSLEAAAVLEAEGISLEIIDLRTIAPIDKSSVCDSVSKTGRLVVVDEDYESFGLSGELAAISLEEGIRFKYGRVCTQSTIPYARDMEDHTLPNVKRIVSMVKKII